MSGFVRSNTLNGYKVIFDHWDCTKKLSKFSTNWDAACTLEEMGSVKFFHSILLKTFLIVTWISSLKRGYTDRGITMETEQLLSQTAETHRLLVVVISKAQDAERTSFKKTSQKTSLTQESYSKN